METDANPIKDVLDDLFALLESLETQNIAVLQFLKDQGIAPDDKLAPYLERAGAASSVKWRAARARMNYLLAPAPKKTSEPPPEKETKDKDAKSEDAKSEGAKPENAEPKDGPAKHSGPKEPEPGSEKRSREDQRPSSDAPKAPSVAQEPQAKEAKAGTGNTDTKKGRYAATQTRVSAVSHTGLATSFSDSRQRRITYYMITYLSLYGWRKPKS
jgi:hypothetical protein